MRHEFATPEPPKLRVAIPAGRIEIETGEAAETVVEVEAIRGHDEDVRVEQRGDQIVVETRKRFGLLRSEEYAVSIRAPYGAPVETEAASADLRIHGRVGTLSAKTASGEVDVDHADGGARIRSASGDVAAAPRRRQGGRQHRLRRRRAGDGHRRSLRPDSPRATSAVAEAEDGVSVYTASGDQRIGSAVRGTVDLKSASGDVRVGIRRGSRLHVDARSMSGETTSELELGAVETDGEGPLVELKAATMSGDVRVERA